MSPRSAPLLTLVLGCSALLDFDPATLPARDASSADATLADASAADGASPPSCAVPCSGGLACERGACVCPGGTRDCGSSRSPRCRACCDDAHCDDNNGCTSDRCDNNGRCSNRGCEGNRVCCDRARCCSESCTGRCM